MPKQTITAVFDTRDHAESAALSLHQIGIPAADVVLSPENARDELSAVDARGTATEPRRTGFMASLENLFGGYDDRVIYAEGVRRGGTLLTAHVDDDAIDRAVSLLEQHGAIDLEEREESWRSTGWTGGAAGSGSAREGSAREGLAREGLARERVSDVGAAVVATAPAMPTPTLAAAETRTTAAPIGTTVVPAAAAAVGGRDDVVQVVEERLDVGKRAVSRGKVRLHSYVVSREVNEDVTLHGETVTVDRRTVDRPVSAAVLDADPFRERTIELEEFAEEAVVAKSAHVVEEIGIRKEGTDRVETVHETLRSTKVDVEDDRTGRAVAGTAAGVAAGAVAGAAGRFASEIRDGLEVVGSDGAHVGTVDRIDGERIKLRRADPASGGEHHWLTHDLVASVAGKVVLAVTAAEARARWAAA